MSFNVSAGNYAKFMGRYAEPLAVQFVDLAEIRSGQRALDVGCGPGALTAQLAARLGVDAVAAIDPSASFVAAAQERFPGLDVQLGFAETLPFADDTFDVALAQLVVHFMKDPVAGLTEMARVTRPGGLIGASVWDHSGGTGPLALFWRAVHDVDPGALDEAGLAGAHEGQLAALCEAAGLTKINATKLTVAVRYATFDEWWDPFTLGVGPAGGYLARVDEERSELVRARCAELLPAAPFDISGSAWCVTARVPSVSR